MSTPERQRGSEEQPSEGIALANCVVEMVFSDCRDAAIMKKDFKPLLEVKGYLGDNFGILKEMTLRRGDERKL